MGERLRADVPVRAVSAIPIVIDLKILEDHLMHRIARRDSLAVDRLGLLRLEEGLRTRVVPW